MTFNQWFLTSHSGLSLQAVEAILSLSAEGATVPFIARYRKEQTGGADEVQIQLVLNEKEKWDRIEERKSFILKEIERQQKLTPELKTKLEATYDLTLLEDLYLPYKVKRKTKAALAKEAGLEPLADWIWEVGHGITIPEPGQSLEIWAFTFRNEAKGITDANGAIEGAQDILIEKLSEMLELRQTVRERLFSQGCVRSKPGKSAKPNSKFEHYFKHSEPITSLSQPENSHRYLAMKRGWIEEELVLDITGPQEGEEAFESEMLSLFENQACTQKESSVSSVLLKAALLAYKAFVRPSIDNEVHKHLKSIADQAAILVFSENLRSLLLASPLGAKAVLGVDPGIRTGCKIVVVNSVGKFLADSVIYIHTEAEKEKAIQAFAVLFKSGEIQAVAVGNGTAGREAEAVCRLAVKSAGVSIPVVMVNEAGASVYSASEAAREEFPNLDVTVRGAISIARRLQDPLAELVKIDPKSIGVGQYQHDVSPQALKKSLMSVVESSVNQVGVELNTASHHLLAYVSGIGPSLAKAIVEKRNELGLFSTRTQLLEVSRFTKKVFEQAAGFLRIAGGIYPLDNTGIHPERYEVLEKFAARIGQPLEKLTQEGVKYLKQDPQIKQELGQFTFDDIIKELEKPGRDPRDPFKTFEFREDIHELSDLKPGMICPGIVTNVTNFGAFVDIGVHQDGLVHISQISQKFVKDPKEVLAPGNQVKVRVLEVNLEKKQIALSMRMNAEVEKPKAPLKMIQKAQVPSTPVSKPILKPKILPNTRPMVSTPKPMTSPKASTKAPIRVKEAFNNPFAGLSSLRDELKSQKKGFNGK